jgi:hypothetical protein
MLSQEMMNVIVGYITNYSMSLYVILHFSEHHCVLSQTTGFHCMLSHKLLDITVRYLTK